VAGLVPEIEAALREGKLGPHILRVEITPLPPELVERRRRLNAERKIEN
jgi:hypothetical protein